MAGFRTAVVLCSVAGVTLLFAASVSAQTLDLPPRLPSAEQGCAFARSIAALPLNEREARILAEVKAGNVPPFLRKFAPVSVSAGPFTASYFVAPDYLAIGSDHDYFLTPLTPRTAQAIADLLDCMLPTPKMVDDIYATATIKLTPAPIPPSPAMTTVDVFLRHNEIVRHGQSNRPLGELVAGHKKDVVISNKGFRAPDKVAIYGWHKLDGKPIQPLYAGHVDSWVDYSHGIRLVRRRMTVDGKETTAEAVLADPKRARLLSDEGAMVQTRYQHTDLALALRAAPGSRYDVMQLEGGVRVVIDRPAAASVKPILLVFYALPNGNTIEQTIGKSIKPGDDWHFDIQHIGAQVVFLREKIQDRQLVVAYLENSSKSWPTWRKTHGDAPISAIVDAVQTRHGGPHARIVLSGHSGGGSFIFGFLNSFETIPDQVFLDANYAYQTDLHEKKLTSWLKESDAHYLVVLAYNDSVALLDGKPFVSASGGTWGRSRQMLNDLKSSMPFTKETSAGLERSRTLSGRVKFLLRDNPERKVLHTVQVEKNGFIESLLSGTKVDGTGYTYFGDRAYNRFILAD